MGGLADQIEENQLHKVEALIDSMTPTERSKPDIIDKSRAKRIARGSGQRSSEVKQLVQRFEQMREMMASLGSGGMLSKIPGMSRLAGAGGMDPMALLAGSDAGSGRAGPGVKAQERRRTKQKGKRKQARKARRKNRKR
jgi:signal recognition particle subunit SRP54